VGPKSGEGAAPGYRAAKLVIKLVNAVAERVNADRATAGLLRVAFLPNYRVSLAERIFPASDLSEQNSTAGKEASGTGNMKFSMNGALSIGTLDGANLEIREAVGHENFFLFGLTAEQVAETQRSGYEPRRYYEENGRLRAALDAIAAGAFSPHDAHLFRPLVNDLLERDEYLLLADFGAYLEAQCAAEEAYRDPDRWARMAILNVARMGRFSSDRTVLEYAQNIWGARPLSLQAGKA
jgi:starch phosphorylase